MKTVDDYFYELEGKQKETALFLHHFISNCGLHPTLRYKIPFYDHVSWVCYINTVKKGGVELAFIRGNELSNIQGILEFRGRKMVSGIIYYSPAEININPLNEILQEAIILDETIPYTFKGK